MRDHEREQRDLALDACIERLLSGADWRHGHDGVTGDGHQLAAMMGIAESLSEASQTSAPPDLARRRTWLRFNVQRRCGIRQRVLRALGEFDVSSPVFRVMSATSFASSFSVLTAAAAGFRFA